MPRKDFRGQCVTGATPTSLDAFESALTAFQRWRTGADAALSIALADAPRFTMAHVLDAYLRVLSRDPVRVRSAHGPYATLRGLRANRREALHIAAIGTTLDDDYEGAKLVLTLLLAEYPTDVLALQVVHAFDYATGDADRLADRVATVMPAWSPSLPGYPAVLAMQAFSHSEDGDHARAEAIALAALEQDPLDGRAHHALAHVHEMTGRPDAGLRRLKETTRSWADGTTVSTHVWWHAALFHLALDRCASALSLYDEHVRAGHSREVSDLIDASALLWRLELAGCRAGTRWTELAEAWAPHLGDRFCSFNDLHAMLAFVGARDWALAGQLERDLLRSAAAATRHAETTRDIGLPACRAILAFGQGDHARTAELIARLPPKVRRIGGSHAQRDVLYLTLMHAIERLRRPPMRNAA